MNRVQKLRLRLVLTALAVFAACPTSVQAQLQKVPPAIPAIDKVNGPMPAYAISGLALVLVAIIAFRSAHRRRS